MESVDKALQFGFGHVILMSGLTVQEGISGPETLVSLLMPSSSRRRRASQSLSLRTVRILTQLRLVGLGVKARAKKLTPELRREIAKKATEARYAKK